MSSAVSSEVSLDDVQDHYWHWAHDDGGKGTLTRAEAPPLVSTAGTLPGSFEDNDEDMTPVPGRGPNSKSGFSFPPQTEVGEQGTTKGYNIKDLTFLFTSLTETFPSRSDGTCGDRGAILPGRDGGC